MDCNSRGKSFATRRRKSSPARSNVIFSAILSSTRAKAFGEFPTGLDPEFGPRVWAIVGSGAMG